MYVYVESVRAVLEKKIDSYNSMPNECLLLRSSQIHSRVPKTKVKSGVGVV